MANSANREPTLLETIFDVVRLSKSTTGNMSLVDITKFTRVEPIAIVNKDLLKVKEYNNILNGVLNIYLGYYIQAVQMLSVSYTDAKVLKTLDSVSPDRSFIVESLDPFKTVSLEDSLFRLPGMRGDEDEHGIKEHTSLSQKVEYLDKMQAVGKIVEIKFSLNDGEMDDQRKQEMKEVTIPVQIRLMTTLVESSVMGAILTSNEDEVTFTSRLKDVFSGRIRFFRDFVMAQDLIKKQKKILFKDGADAYNEILKRYNNSAMLTLFNRGNVGYGKISSIYVMTEEDEANIKKKFGSGLSSTKIRDMIFNNSLAMIIVVVDREWERVTIYVKDTAGSSTAAFSEFKNAKDGDIGAQIGDILKGLSMGNSAML